MQGCRDVYFENTRFNFLFNEGTTNNLLELKHMVCGAELVRDASRCRQEQLIPSLKCHTEEFRLFPLGQWSPRRDVTTQNNSRGRRKLELRFFFRPSF